MRCCATGRARASAARIARNWRSGWDNRCERAGLRIGNGEPTRDAECAISRIFRVWGVQWKQTLESQIESRRSSPARLFPPLRLTSSVLHALLTGHLEY